MRLTLSSILLLTVCTANAQTLYRQNSTTKNTLYTVAFPGDSANVGLAAGASGTLVTTSDGGQNWQETALGTGNLYASYFNDTSSGAIGGESGVLVIKIPGQSPFPVQLSLAEPIRGITYSAYDTAICVGMSGLIFITRDSGKTWSKIKPPALLATHDFYGVNWWDDSTYWIVGAGGVVLYTEDAGTTWQRIAVPTTKDLYSITFPSDGQTGWIAGDQTLLYTTDYGTNWTSIPTTASLRYIDGYGDSALINTGYAVGLGGVLLTSNNNPAHWSNIPTGTIANLYGLDFPDSLYVVGDSGIILTTLPPPASQTASYQAIGYDFTPVPFALGYTSHGQIAILNNGPIVDSFSSIAIQSSNFVFDTAPDRFFLLPGQDRFLQITFTPAHLGKDSTTVVITSPNAGVQTVPLLGEGIAVSGVMPDDRNVEYLTLRNRNDNAYLELPATFQFPIRLTILDELGIERESIDLQNSGTRLELDLVRGAYFYRLRSALGVSTGKIWLP